MSDWAADNGWREVYTSLDVECALGRMSHAIRRAHTDPVKPLVLVPILKGGLWTAYQLLNRLVSYVDQCPDIRIGHMGISSYGNDQIPGKMKHTYTLDLDTDDLRGSNVWLIDDIWDTGATLRAAWERIPTVYDSLSTAVLVVRGTLETAKHLDVNGLAYAGSEFLAGCGMGIGELHRHHPSIYAAKENK